MPASSSARAPSAAAADLESGRYLKSGDVIELEVEGLGLLRNRIIKA